MISRCFGFADRVLECTADFYSGIVFAGAGGITQAGREQNRNLCVYPQGARPQRLAHQVPVSPPFHCV